ncbi:MAG: hypothetical protein ACOZFS_12495 [Thermodesulfobacteriota bacterium]
MDPAERKLKIYEVLVKGIIGALVVGIITFMGAWMETSRRTLADQEAARQKRLADQEEANRLMIAENNKTMATLSQLSAKQKEMDVELGMQMFQTLMAHYLQASRVQDGIAKRQQQMLLLRLISLNFQDSPINIKPLFEDLDHQLTDAGEKQQLQDIAMDVARHQTFRLISLSGDAIDREVVEGTEILLAIPATIKIEEVGLDKIKASLTSKIIPEKPKTLGPFTVNYFDTPLNDNTKLGPWRVALLLINSDGKKATVRAVSFDSYLAPDRFDIKELTQDFRAGALTPPEKTK